jgi:hypothetical protein
VATSSQVCAVFPPTREIHRVVENALPSPHLQAAGAGIALLPELA